MASEACAGQAEGSSGGESPEAMGFHVPLVPNSSWVPKENSERGSWIVGFPTKPQIGKEINFNEGGK